MRATKYVLLGVLSLLSALSTVASAGPMVAVWLDGQTTDGGNPIARINTLFGPGSATLVTTAQLATPGFLNSYSAVVVSRYGSSYGTGLGAAAAANVKAFVGAPGPAQGGVALFNWDAADNLLGTQTGDPYDPNIDQLFVNAVELAVQSGHGYVGELNGAAMAYTANNNGFMPLGLLAGTAGPLQAFGPQFIFHYGSIGSGNALDAGLTFPFSDADDTTYQTIVTGYPSGDAALTFNDGTTPAVIANQSLIQAGQPQTPEPSALMIWAMVGAAGIAFGWSRQKKRLA